jgi:hypothetical protein
MKVIICGSPHWAYPETVKDNIAKVRRVAHDQGSELLIIHGGEPGPETVAQEYCRELGIDTIIQETVRVRGESSYYRRNELMLNYHSPDLVICFSYSFKESVVTSDMLKRAEAKGIKTKPVDYESVVRRDPYNGEPIKTGPTY